MIWRMKDIDKNRDTQYMLAQLKKDGSITHLKQHGFGY